MIACAMESALNEYLNSLHECECNYIDLGYSECICAELQEEADYAYGEQLAEQEQQREYDLYG